jgi:hypothetical protein
MIFNKVMAKICHGGGRSMVALAIFGSCPVLCFFFVLGGKKRVQVFSVMQAFFKL